MKKFLFTLTALVALVLLANTTFAQTNLTPYANGSTVYSYSWAVTSDATHAFYMSTSAPTATPTGTALSATTYTDYTVASVTSGSETTATITISWNASALTTGTYYLTFLATSTDNCTNYRYVEITPKTAVDFAIYAVGVSGDPDAGDLTTLTTETGNDGGDACAPETRVSADYLSTSSSTGSDGYVYVFFRIDRLNGTTTNDWTASVSTSVTYGSTDGSITELQYSTDASTWTSSTTNSDDTDVLYVRAKIEVPTGSNDSDNAVVSSEITAASTYETSATGVLAYDSDASNNGAKTYTVDAVPAIGSFTEE